MADPEQRWQIEVSNDLQTWEPIPEVLGSTVLPQFDTEANARFFRATVIE